MTSNRIDETFFVAGGTLKATTPSYVKRPADDELFEAVMAGQLCYVLTPRQMGKSSLMTRASRRLEEQGIRTASIDLTSIGTQVTAQQWYTSIISQLNRRLNLGIDAQEWCKQQEGLAQVQILISFIEEIILERITGRAVVFIDEIDSTLNLDFRDDFFAGLRALYNARTDKPAFERISFVLLGVASPSDLIADRARTPFNIGRAIALQEFDFEHAQVLQEGLAAIYPGQGEPILQRIFHWTNGHPYLTQKLCSEIVERQQETWSDAEIDQLVHELFLSEQARKETNLKFVQDRLLDNPRRSALLGLYQHILRGKVREEGQSALQNELKLSGLVRTEENLLKVRNLIYATVFNVRWAQANTPQNWPKIAAIVFAVLSFALLSVFTYDFVVGNLSKQYAGEIAIARTPKDRLQSLYNLFELRGIFTPDYDYLARESFYPLTWDKQIALFTDPHIDVQEKKLYLIPVVRGLYVTMANVPGGQDSTELLSAMNEALKGVDSNESQELQEEIDWWLQARHAGISQEGIDDYNQAIALESGNPSTYFERARVALKMGKYELALSDMNVVMALAQNISTESQEKEVPTLTPRPILTKTLISASLAPVSATSTTLNITQTPGTLINVTSAAPTATQTGLPILLTQTVQPETTPPSGYELRESYQSSFFSTAYIHSAVSLLLDDGLLVPAFVSFSSQTDKYPNLVSSGLLQPRQSLPLTSTSTPSPEPAILTLTSVPSSESAIPNFAFTPSPTPVLDPAAQVISDYWSLFGNRDFAESWKLLSPGFQERNYRGQLNEYLASQVQEYCGVFLTEPRILTATSENMYILGRVVYKEKGSCIERPALLVFKMLMSGSTWVIDGAFDGVDADSKCDKATKKLSVGGTARVAHKVGLWVRAFPGASDVVPEVEYKLDILSPDTDVSVIDGPICAVYNGIDLWWWKVHSVDIRVNGWVVEGTDSENPIFLQPVAQATEVFTTTSAPPTTTPQPAAVSEKDGMRLHYVPAGTFIMGSDLGGPNERPAHLVTLDAFWIDETEVTNRMYALCVTTSACRPPSNNASSTRKSYYDNPQYADYPVILVFWKDAQNYCTWAGRALPSEAQWEKAASRNGPTYPWGNRAPNKDLLNYNNDIGDTTEVGVYPNGMSFYGALDMAGNVWEWVNDWYDAAYYASSPSSNPPGPVSGQYRVLRGGSWGDEDYSTRSAYRFNGPPDYRDVNIGFRCALSQ
jgi:formylglycine-generating enzyme required for sulfatase activity